MAMSLGERLEELARFVLAPLILGGPMQLVAPIGPQIALALGYGRRISDDSLRTEIDVARVRQARTVAPIDVLPDVSPAEWAMAAALNDLLQATNQELSGPLTRARHAQLVDASRRLLEAIPAPRSVIEVIVRHATFARLAEVTRIDTVVRSWIGSESYRGIKPPARVLAWPGMRRVDVQETKIKLGHMPEGLDALLTQPWLPALGLLYARTPLTDLMSADRSAPVFGWSPSTVGLVAFDVGRSLARRALRHERGDAAIARLKAAGAVLAQGNAKSLVGAFVGEMAGEASVGGGR